MQLDQVAAWLAIAIRMWAPHAAEEVVSRASREIVLVAYDSQEPKLFSGNLARARGALVVAVTAAQESGFREDVQAGDCRPWECDHGRAACWMQVHPQRGMVLTPMGFEWRAVSGSILRSSLLGVDNEQTCFRAGYHMILASLRRDGTLRSYTGEGRNKMPLATVRMRLVDAFLESHAPPARDSEVEGVNITM